MADEAKAQAGGQAGGQADGGFPWGSSALVVIGIVAAVGVFGKTGPGSPLQKLLPRPAPRTKAVLAAQATPYRPALMEIPAGSFIMGSPADEPGRRAGEDQHQVRLTRRFLMMATEVTQEQYRQVVHEEPAQTRIDAVKNTCKSAGIGPDHPVYCVDFYEVAAYANRLSELEGLERCYTITRGDSNKGDSIDWPHGLNCLGYRLPTEAEWEYAARGGGTLRYGATESPEEIAWYDQNSDGHTHPVAQKKPNNWGLYDMTGNVWEWVWDFYYPFSSQEVVDPIGPPTGTNRLYHGGSWGYTVAQLRVAFRAGDIPTFRFQHLGFRLARSAPASQ